MSVVGLILLLAAALASVFRIASIVLVVVKMIGLLRPTTADRLRETTVYAVCRRLYRETRPFFLPAALLDTGYLVVTTGEDVYYLFGLAIHGPVGSALSAALHIYFYYVMTRYIDDDDDRWRDRRERALGVVRSIGHRLVVAPVPIGGGAS